VSEHPTNALSVHGSSNLPAVIVDTYNAELRDGDGFIGDRASNRAFRAILDEWRERLRKVGDDPLGNTPTEDLSKKKLDKVLLKGEPEAAGVVYGTIEDFASELATVTQRFLRLKAWRDTRCIVVGGGLRASRIGEVAIGRASVLLKASGHDIELKPIRHHPDEAALLGSLHLAPAWIFTGFDGILAVDIGGTNMRVGLVLSEASKAADLSESHVAEFELWRYGDEKPKPKREEVVEHLGKMLDQLIRRAAKSDVSLAPFSGVACPGIIDESGTINSGGQNLPGNWESTRFNLPARLCELVPTIGDQRTTVVMHNDAVVHGLSEVPFMRAVDRWGVMTIGTGLGNARFTNRRAAEQADV
jgi:hypothetical protein